MSGYNLMWLKENAGLGAIISWNLAQPNFFTISLQPTLFYDHTCKFNKSV